MTWLVTGGAGYIGAHVVRALSRDGVPTVVLDDLSRGDPARLPAAVPLVVGSVLDTRLILHTLGSHRITGVIHLAGRKSVEESISEPLEYYRDNVLGLHSLLGAMRDAHVTRLLFSSSAAVYGAVATGVVDEESPTIPLSPYGRTKLVSEQLLRDVAAAHGLSWAALRYFNVAGSADPALADRGEDNLIPRIFRAVEQGVPPQVFGLDHATPDGSCVRDYIHVADLADAHAAVIHQLRTRALGEIYNIGCGTGVSVLQVIEAVGRASGTHLRWEAAPARPGDPDSVVADPHKIRHQLGWKAHHDLDAIITSAWRAARLRPLVS